MKEMIKRIGSFQPARFDIGIFPNAFGRTFTRRSSHFGVFTNGPEYQWAFYPQQFFPKCMGVNVFMTQQAPLEMSGTDWQNLRNDVR